MKTDRTTKILLGVIATGIAALTAIAFERRYLTKRPGDLADDLIDSAGNTYDNLKRKVHQAGHDARREAESFKHRVEDGVETLREKAGALKDRVSESMERAGTQLHAGAESVQRGMEQGLEEVREGATEAVEQTRHALDSSKI